MTAIKIDFIAEEPRAQSHRHSKNPWLIWQLADSAFPIGGFAHSGGLEAAWQHGEIRTRSDLDAFLKNQITQCGYAALPFVSHAHLEPGRLAELDAMFNAFTTNHVANRASRLQGNAFLVAVERAFGAKAKTTYGHLAPVYGAVLASLGINRHTCVRLFLFGQLRTTVSSAVRLGIIGPLEAQAVQNTFSAHAERTFQRAATLTLDDIAQTAPLADLWQAAQDRLYSRLFQS
jgi:urease accessory protein